MGQLGAKQDPQWGMEEAEAGPFQEGRETSGEVVDIATLFRRRALVRALLINIY